MFGKIIDMEDDYIIIENAAHKLDANYLNFHVVFPESNRLVVGEIINMTDQKIKVVLVGEIRNSIFTPNVFRNLILIQYQDWFIKVNWS